MNKTHQKAWSVWESDEGRVLQKYTILADSRNMARLKYQQDAWEVNYKIDYINIHAIRNKGQDLMVNSPRPELAGLTEEQIETLQHFIGNTNSEIEPDRNYYQASYNTDTYKWLETLKEKGWLTEKKLKYGSCFYLTDLGLDIVNSSLPIPREMM